MPRYTGNIFPPESIFGIFIKDHYQELSKYLNCDLMFIFQVTLKSIMNLGDTKIKMFSIEYPRLCAYILVD